MIGLGLDLCQISRMERILSAGDSFLNRYFAPEERAYIEKRGKTGPQSAAAMFAAKEALLKALGTGLGAGVELRDVRVLHDETGAPRYELCGGALQRLTQLGGARAHVSLTHEGDIAAAVAVVE